MFEEIPQATSIVLYAPRMSMLKPDRAMCVLCWIFLMPLEVGENGQNDGSDRDGACGNLASPLHSRYLPLDVKPNAT